MKFSKRKKRKIKKNRQRRVRKTYGYVRGLTISKYSCIDIPDKYGYVKVIDKTYINGELYFLVISKSEKFFIYKVFDIAKYSYVSTKKLIKYKKHFENSGQWHYNSVVNIDDTGIIDVSNHKSYYYY